MVSTGNRRSRLCELPFYLPMEAGDSMGEASCCCGCRDRGSFSGEEESAVARAAAGGAMIVPMCHKMTVERCWEQGAG